ncbi:MAG: RNA methyltransferase [Pyrinomonadaceae bacterium]|nr:RNA methyltransferase [Pyrinomonadaceae bacterium]
MNNLPIISSRDNQRLVRARKVRDRHISGKIFLEGKRLSEEALRSDLAIEECFVSEKFVNSVDNADILKRLAETSRFVFELPDRVFHTIAATDHSQGVVLIAERPEHTKETIENSISTGSSLPIVLVLFQINNPANLGAVLRTAEAAGIAGIIVTESSTDVYSPKSLRASMGAALRLPVWTDITLDAAIAWAGEFGLEATATGAQSTASHTEIDWLKPRLLIFGSEAHGLNESQLEFVPERIRIPMDNQVESLNLAVATGIILFEAKRQIQSRSSTD